MPCGSPRPWQWTPRDAFRGTGRRARRVTAGNSVWQALRRTTDAWIEGLNSRADDDAGMDLGGCRRYERVLYAPYDPIVKACDTRFSATPHPFRDRKDAERPGSPRARRRRRPSWADSVAGARSE